MNSIGLVLTATLVVVVGFFGFGYVADQAEAGTSAHPADATTYASMKAVYVIVVSLAALLLLALPARDVYRNFKED